MGNDQLLDSFDPIIIMLNCLVAFMMLEALRKVILASAAFFNRLGS